MTAGAFGIEKARPRHLFRRGDLNELHLSIGFSYSTAFVQRELASDLVPVLAHDEVHTHLRISLLTRFGQENHVAVKGHFQAMQQHYHLQTHGGHAFVIHGAAAVDITVFDGAGEWVHRPPTPLDTHHVEMSHQQQGFLLAAALEPRHQVSPALLLFEVFRGNPFLVQERLQVFSPFGLVAGRTGRIDFDEPGENPDDFIPALFEVG